MTRDARLAWNQIRTVLLDMDGTLLDLHFDDFFWRRHVPKRYAEKHGLNVEEARNRLYSRFRELEGSMNWYCLDFWSRELDLDIPLLKREIHHLITVHPFVVEFLEWIRARGKRSILVTNAHAKSLSLKMEKTELEGHFDRLVCAHDLGLPKEDTRFWGRLKVLEAFDETSTLLIDDNLSVLRSAREAGIRFLLSIRRPNTQAPLREIKEFPSILGFEELIPHASDS